MTAACNDHILSGVASTRDLPVRVSLEVTEVIGPDGESERTARSVASLAMDQLTWGGLLIIPSTEIVPSAFDHDSEVPFGSPLQRISDLTFARSVDDI